MGETSAGETEAGSGSGGRGGREVRFAPESHDRGCEASFYRMLRHPTVSLDPRSSTEKLNIARVGVRGRTTAGWPGPSADLPITGGGESRFFSNRGHCVPTALPHSESSKAAAPITMA